MATDSNNTRQRRHGMLVLRKAKSGGDHSVAVDKDGWLWVWGENGDGQLGLGGTTDRNRPTRIETLNLLSYPPSVSVTNPANGLMLTNAAGRLALEAEAEDPDGTVAKVEFFVGTNSVGMDTSAPWAATWTNLPVGAWTITAKATDNKGVSVVSAPVVVNVFSDGDTLGDAWEQSHFGSLEAAPEGDADGDGLSNEEEEALGTRPGYFDTDQDLLSDGFEEEFGLDPLVADDIHADPDNDGLSTLRESVFGTSPTNPDSDGDGSWDGWEADNGANPANSADGGQAPPEEDRVTLRLRVGDPSGSESERYNMVVRDLATGGRVLRHQAPEYGEVAEDDYVFLAGHSYEIEIVHTGTEPGFRDENGFSNYDWEAGVERVDGGGAVAMVIDDPEPILTTVVDWPNDTFRIQGKKAYLGLMRIKWTAVDGNPALADNKAPGNGAWMPGQGLKIYPDATSPDDQTPRNRVRVEVSGVPPGAAVHLRAFDVDDPSGDPVIDDNDAGTGGRGGDNLARDWIGGTVGPMFLASGNDTVQCTADSAGVAKINGQLPELEVTMQPGDNFRVAAWTNAADVAGLQVQDGNSDGYVGWGNEPIEGFPGVATPMLTVWRRLHIELDSMPAPPTPKPSPDRAMAVGVSWATNSPAVGVSTLTLDEHLPKGENFYEGGYIQSGQYRFEISANTETAITVYHNGTGSVPPPTNELAAFVGQAFEVRDDDDRGPNNTLLALLPDHGLINSEVKGKFGPAYIEVVELGGSMNPNTVAPFKLNIDPRFEAGDTAQDLKGKDREEFWYHYVVAGYQGPRSNDSDPTGAEHADSGGTTTKNFYGAGNVYSHVYLEVVRDLEGAKLSDPSGFAASFALRKILVTAHEIGHGPRNRQEHHGEDGLMAANAAGGSDFESISLKRFRGTPKWSER